jgi:hypothetical protein
MNNIDYDHHHGITHDDEEQEDTKTNNSRYESRSTTQDTTRFYN